MGCRKVNKSSKLKSALVVVGGSLAATQAPALELGEVKVHSTLGQPLRASIAYALAPNEAISDSCVSIQPTRGVTGLPSIEQGSLIVTNGVIAITGNAIVREPMVAMRVSIRCQYTPQLVRDYMLFVDPANPATVAAPVASQVPIQPQVQAAPAQQPARPAARPAVTSREPIVGTRYQVQAGDSASVIVQRIENRTVGLWPAVDAIVAANPDAFVDGDPNKLKAGSWLTIPNLGAGAAIVGPAAEAPVAVASEQPATTATPAATVYEPVEAAAETAAEPAAAEPAAAAPESALADLQPGDVIASDNPYIQPAGETVSIPDTQLEGPEITATSPNQPVAVIRTPDASADAAPTASNWLWWLGGGAAAIIAALLLFGRRFRGRYGSTPIAPVVPQRRATDGDTQKIEAVSNVDDILVDESPTTENLALDADLIMGTGLQEGTEVDVAQDFSFASTTKLDLELPEEMSSGGDAISETDIIPPLRTDEHAILESEILPEDDDYDMSVIVDATKMPHPDGVTERDLEAIQVEVDDETLITGDYTVSQEVDYKILEQDYEDELTATQALNAEIQKAADDLANLDATSEMPIAETEETAHLPLADEEETIERPLATVHELDVTAQMPAKDEEENIADDEDTGINPTVNMEAEGDTVNLNEGDTVEMPKGKAN